MKSIYTNNIARNPNHHRQGQKTSEGNYYPGDGGAIQYGFSFEINNIYISFIRFKFTQNKAVGNEGALDIQTIKTCNIINCTFGDNVANYQASRQSADLLFDNYYFLKEKGRGGAPFISIQLILMKIITVREIAIEG